MTLYDFLHQHWTDIFVLFFLAVCIWGVKS